MLKTLKLHIPPILPIRGDLEIISNKIPYKENGGESIFGKFCSNIANEIRNQSKLLQDLKPLSSRNCKAAIFTMAFDITCIVSMLGWTESVKLPPPLYIYGKIVPEVVQGTV